MKKIIYLALCLILIMSSLTGCFQNKTYFEDENLKVGLDTKKMEGEDSIRCYFVVTIKTNSFQGNAIKVVTETVFDNKPKLTLAVSQEILETEKGTTHHIIYEPFKDLKEMKEWFDSTTVTAEIVNKDKR